MLAAIDRSSPCPVNSCTQFVLVFRGFVDVVKQFGRKLQGGLPIVGLISRLSSPGGGFDDLVRTYTSANVPTA